MGIAKINEKTLKIKSNVHLVYQAGSTSTWEFVEEITVTEAGNVDRNTTPSGEFYKNLYKDMMVTITNPEAKPCTFAYIYRENCLNRVSVTMNDAGDFVVFKSEMIMEGLAEWSGSKTKSDGYGSNMVVSYKETTDKIQRVLVGSCAAGTTVKIYGRRA